MSRSAHPVPRAGGRRRATPARRRRRRPPLGPLLVVVLALALVTAVLGAGVALLGPAGAPTAEVAPPPGASPQGSPRASAGTSAGTSAGRTRDDASAPRRPAPGSCYDLTWAEAVASTTTVAPTSCAAPHTARTIAVGTLPTLVEGHLLAVDSQRVRQAAADACPGRLRDLLGGDAGDLRLSVLRAVWFTPTLEESDRGADWYRCDVVAVAGEERLAPLEGSLEGLLDRPGAAAAYALCGTAEPGTAGFDRVACSRPHRWRAIEVVELDGEDYPGDAAVRAAGRRPCRDAARDRAEDPLTFRWGYGWPTRDQWRAGTTWGLCWVPD